MRDHARAVDLFLLAFLGDDHDVHRLGALEKRHGIRDGARRGAAAIPAHDHAIKLEPLLLDIGHHDERASGFEQRCLDHEPRTRRARVAPGRSRLGRSDGDPPEPVAPPPTPLPGRVSTETPAALALAWKRSAAAFASLLFSSRWSSITSTGMPPSVPSGMTGS